MANRGHIFQARRQHLLQLLLGADVGGVPTGLFAAVGSTGVQPGIALPADHLVTVVLLGKKPERGLDDSTTQTKHQVKSGLLLDVVIGEGPAVLKLLASEDQTLLVRGDSLRVLVASKDKCRPRELC